MGWRYWIWNPAKGCLRSPINEADWFDGELRCDEWDESSALRGRSGIHARFVPKDWTDSDFTPPVVTGIVERFGKFVLGTEGWRAEWCIVKKLCVIGEDTADALRRAYPDAEVIVKEIEHEDRRDSGSGRP
jgi:hypothetical protein